MKVFYIPDGHRRWAERNNSSLQEAYRRGYEVMVERVIFPLLRRDDIDCIGIFLLSALNLQRRDFQSLQELRCSLKLMIPMLQSDLMGKCSVCTHDWLFNTPSLEVGVSARSVHLFLGCNTDDVSPIGEVDLLIRSGNEMRLSGAPRSLIGPYTEFSVITKLHPDLDCQDLDRAVDRFTKRYPPGQ